MDSATAEINKEGEEKKNILRIMCQDKSLFVEFAENELNITRFPEKGKKIYVYCYFP